MDSPQPKETKGVPWADHNETESTPPDTRREEYEDAEPGQTADERAAADSGDSGSSATERPTDEDRGEVEHDL